MHHLSILAPASLIDFHSAGCMATRYPGAIFNYLAIVDSYLRGAQKIAVNSCIHRIINAIGKINAVKVERHGIEFIHGPNLIQRAILKLLIAYKSLTHVE